MLMETWFKNARGEFQSAGIVESGDVDGLLSFFSDAVKATNPLSVCFVGRVGETVYVNRANAIGVEMEKSEIVLDNEHDAMFLAKSLRLLQANMSYQTNDTSWLASTNNQYVPLGTPVSFPDANHIRVDGTDYKIVSACDEYVHLKNGGRIRYTGSPTVIEGKVIKSVTGLKEFSREVVIVVEGGTLRLGHERQCCEEISLLDFNGREKDLVGKTVRVAEVKYGGAYDDETFYEIRTDGGDLWLRFGDADNSSRYGSEIDVRWEPEEGR